ncbi:MazG nucleotide pyrophosphohydrolase domain-containing protein [Devriesea agamarum]|uniref:MazG nucleotide pyrophosphohydrolase domain-containing protein n=1 Tax=Devriesea agamarum TaxID=472569 RepID=UPI001E46F110|nr:MazG nucleotide pyrophosphohydrolase domain-containing protein [Devriesea agamarum]
MRLNILPVSTRNAPGLLTARGWDEIRAATVVLLSCSHPGWVAHLREAGCKAVSLADPVTPGQVHEAIAGADGAGASGTVAWLVDAESDLASRVDTIAARAGVCDLDYVFASPRAPGSEVVESVRIMHALRSPGGDDWSAAQTHASLARYLVEETYEVLEAIEAPQSGHDGVADSRCPAPGPGDPALVGELGDLLFQIVFHSRLGMEEDPPWTVDDVARHLNEKMLRRNPHVFGTAQVEGIDDIVAQWQQAKQRETPSRGLFDGIPQELPALQRAWKIAHRMRHAAAEGEADTLAARVASVQQRAQGDDHAVLALGAELLALVERAERQDLDAESALRTLLHRIAAI